MRSFFKRVELKPSGLALVLFAAVLNSIALMYVSFLAALVGFAAIIAVVLQADKKAAIYAGALFGAVSSLVLNFWMISVITNYVKGSLLIGILCYLVSAIVLAFFFGLQFFLYNKIKRSSANRSALVNNAMLMACLFVIFEFIRSNIFSAMPWLSYTAGITEARSLFMIQPAVYGGVYLLSFLLIIAAHVVAHCICNKRWKFLFIPVVIFTIQYISGILIYDHTTGLTDKSGNKKFSVALAIPALSPETVWNESSADGLVSRLLTLNTAATQTKADLIVWSETVVPWTYAPDDDFLKEIKKETAKSGSHTLIGMNSAVGNSGDILTNSVYFLEPGGNNYKRYDKQDLLTLVEKPLLNNNGNIILPFLATNGLKMNAGSCNLPVETPWGKAGVMLCNESTSLALANNRVNKGAAFLVNMGNDSWFSKHYIPLQHFYNCRLRAVENRKDVIINNNMGYAGLIKANGKIAAQFNDNQSSVQLVEVSPNNLPVVNTYIFISLITFAALISILNKSLKTNSKSLQ